MIELGFALVEGAGLLYSVIIAIMCADDLTDLFRPHSLYLSLYLRSYDSPPMRFPEEPPTGFLRAA